MPWFRILWLIVAIAALFSFWDIDQARELLRYIPVLLLVLLSSG